MRVAALALLVVGLVAFAVGFMWQADSRSRARCNVATIVAVYFGLVLWLSAAIVQ